MIQSIRKKIKELSTGPLIIAAFFSACILILLLVTTGIVINHNTTFDEFIFGKTRKLISPAFTDLMVFITFFGTFYFLLPGYIALIVFNSFKKNHSINLYIILIGLSSTALLFSLKYFFKRSRPLDPLLHAVNGYSYPSGHSFSGFTFFGILIYMVWQAKMKRSLKWIWSSLLFLFVCMIAFSRIYLRVHFPSDVLAGFCLSVLWLTSAFWLFQSRKKKQAASKI